MGEREVFSTNASEVAEYADTQCGRQIQIPALPLTSPATLILKPQPAHLQNEEHSRNLLHRVTVRTM